jgi:hypothetical protein
MRKLIKEPVKCDSCGQTKEYAEYEEICDQCGKTLPENIHPLTLDKSKNMCDHSAMIELCSWKCVRDYLIANQEEISELWYVSLPMPIFKDQCKEGHCDTGDNFYKDFLCATEASP